MFILRHRACARPLKSALLLLAAVGLIVSTVLLTSAPQAQAAIASPEARLTWVSDQPLSDNTALTQIGDTIYVGGNFPSVGRSSSLGLLDLASGAPAYGLPLVSGEVKAVQPDDAGGWFVGGELTVEGQPGFANLVHIKADKTLDTAWKPRITEPVCGFSRNATTIFVNTLRFGDNMVEGLQAVERGSGRLLWKLDPAPSLSYGCPIASNNDSLFLGTGRTLTDVGRPYGDGGEWDVTPYVRELALAGNTLLVLGSFEQFNGQNLERGETGQGAINLATGANQPFPVTSGAHTRTAVGQGDRMYVYQSFEQDTALHAVDVTTNQIVWTRRSKVRGWALAIGAQGLLRSGVGFQHQPSGPNLAALAASDGAPTDWQPRPDGVVTELAASDTTLCAAGAFTQIAGQARPGLAAFDHPSGALRDWNPQPNGPVSALLAGGGRLYVVGGFTQIAGQPRPGLAAFDLATGALSDWTPSGLPTGAMTPASR